MRARCFIISYCFLTTTIADGFVVSRGTSQRRTTPVRHDAVPSAESNDNPDTIDEELSNTSNNNNRRNVLRSFGMATTAMSAAPSHAAADGLLVDLPMTRLKLPTNALGNDYVAVQLCIPQQSPIDMMLDTGLTLEMITPHLQQVLQLPTESSPLRGLAAGGATQNNGLVTLHGASVCDPTTRQALPLDDLHATVQDFPQEHMDSKHDPVEGMLGQEILSRYDVDLDFPAGRVRLYRPGTAPTKQLVTIPATVINETGLLGFRLRSANSKQQPILAIIDCGSSFSAVNWQAAEYLGLPTNPNDSAYQKGPSIVAIGIDGHPIHLPTIPVPFTFAGNAQKNDHGAVDFADPPPQWKPWNPVQVAVGDLPVFPQLLGDGVRPYTGPAALIGLDVLGQRRVILESSSSSVSTRARRVHVGP